MTTAGLHVSPRSWDDENNRCCSVAPSLVSDACHAAINVPLCSCSIVGAWVYVGPPSVRLELYEYNCCTCACFKVLVDALFPVAGKRMKWGRHSSLLACSKSLRATRSLTMSCLAFLSPVCRAERCKYSATCAVPSHGTISHLPPHPGRASVLTATATQGPPQASKSSATQARRTRLLAIVDLTLSRRRRRKERGRLWTRSRRALIFL